MQKWKQIDNFADNMIYYTINWFFDPIYGGGERMRYLSVTEIAKKWNVSERSVRNYCAQGRVLGAFLTGLTAQDKYKAYLDYFRIA